MNYEWRYGSNKDQEYYETSVGKDCLCVFRNRRDKKHVIWMGHIEARAGNLPPVLYDKNLNDKQREIEGLSPDASLRELKRVAVLCCDNPEEMIKKTETAYIQGVREL